MKCCRTPKEEQTMGYSPVSKRKQNFKKVALPEFRCVVSGIKPMNIKKSEEVRIRMGFHTSKMFTIKKGPAIRHTHQSAFQKRLTIFDSGARKRTKTPDNSSCR
jgi:hypothetical protein